MHIHDFYTKLTSDTDGGSLFEALRNLSRIENPKSLTDQPGLFADDWGPNWPGMEAAM